MAETRLSTDSRAAFFNGTAEAGGHDTASAKLDTLTAFLVELDLRLRERLGLSLLSHEARLVLQLFQKKDVIVKDAWLSSLLSNRAFHELTKRMEADGVVGLYPNDADRRAKSLRLDETFLARLAAEMVPVGDRAHSSYVDALAGTAAHRRDA